MKEPSAFEEMTELPKELRSRLDGCAEIGSVRQIRRQISEKDGTRKYLFQVKRRGSG